MAKLHFVRVDTPRTREQLEELREDIEYSLSIHGRNGDLVVLLSEATWLGAIDMEEESDGFE